MFCRFFAFSLVFAGLPLHARAACPAGPAFTHIVDGGGWKTSFYLLNQSGADADYTLFFRDDAGKPTILHFTDGRADNQVSGTIPAGGISILETTGKDADALYGASATLKSAAPEAVTGFTILRERVKGGADFETSVPLLPASAGTWSIPFDNSSGFSTGIAVAVSCSGQGLAPVSVVAFDESGKQIGKASVRLPSGGHSAFLVADQLPASRDKRGVIRISCDKPASIPFSAIGLRFAPSGALAALPPAVPENRAPAAPRMSARKAPARRAH